jgi:transposase
MPWSTPVVSELRTVFVHAVRTAGRFVAHAARDFGTSRKTAYTWLARFDENRPISDASRKPNRSPNRTSYELTHAVLAVRDPHGWGRARSACSSPTPDSPPGPSALPPTS